MMKNQIYKARDVRQLSSAIEVHPTEIYISCVGAQIVYGRLCDATVPHAALANSCASRISPVPPNLAHRATKDPQP